MCERVTSKSATAVELCAAGVGGWQRGVLLMATLLGLPFLLLGAGPVRAATLGDRSGLYVYEGNDNRIDQYDTVSGAFVGTVWDTSWGSDQSYGWIASRGDMAWTPSGTLLVTVGGNNVTVFPGVVEIDPKTGNVIKKLDLSYQPTDVVLDANGHIFVTGWDTTTVQEYDWNTGFIVKTYAPNVWYRPSGLVVDEARNSLWVYSYWSAGANYSALHQFDLTSGQLLNRYVNTSFLPSYARTGILLAPNGMLYLATSQVGPVVEFDPDAGVFTRAFSGGISYAEDIALGPNNTLYAVESGTGTIAAYDIATGQVIDPAFVMTGGSSTSGLLTDPLTLLAVPEPSGVALTALALFTGAARLVHRRRRARYA
ncbi:MAG: hypothetical protein D6776_05915 [Planctomycetota bacterium]|nr:MAG: hypothetical protein D6776_05915 [Planctomycetota bacterium]